MLVPINKIHVDDRIRKDYGNIDELAEDIKCNGLINDIVVNKEYKLLAGERRLRACKSLGWDQVEVKMMDTRDAEHELNVEISENENRKEFSKAERVDYMRRLFRIEQAKAKERQGDRKQTSDRNLTEVQRADDAVAKQFNLSRDTMRKEMAIVDNKELLIPEDFADWDEGRLSTNKAFMKIKNEKKKLEDIVSGLDEEIRTNLYDISTLKEKIKELENDTRTYTAASFLERNNKDVYRMLDGCDDIYELSREVSKMLEEKLAPLKFRRCFEAVNISEAARNNLNAMINGIYDWCKEISNIINKNEDVIDVY